MNKWLELVKLLAPIIVASTVPGGAVLGPLIAHGISEAEKMKGATGSEKKAHVLNLVSDGVAGINTAKGQEVLDPSATVDAASKAIDTTVAVVNLVNQQAPPKL